MYFCVLKFLFINMIVNIGNNLFFNIKENFWFFGGILLYKFKMILLKVICGLDIIFNK